MLPNPQETADLVTFTEEILNGKPHFLCSVFYTFQNCQESREPLFIDDVIVTMAILVNLNFQQPTRQKVN